MDQVGVRSKESGAFRVRSGGSIEGGEDLVGNGLCFVPIQGKDEAGGGTEAGSIGYCHGVHD